MQRYILSGTYRHVDIIPAFYVELARTNRRSANIILKAYGKVIAEAIKSEKDADLQAPENLRIDVILTLMDALTKCAPEGFRFGSREGAVMHFGYLPIDDD